jgi:vacuolar-type H+-ATPase subunit I/STV1
LSLAAAQFDASCERPAPYWNGIVVITLGIVLIILGFVFSMHLLWALGIILLVIGAVFWILGSAGRPVGGRRYWY